MNLLSLQNVYRWALRYLRPYRRQIALLLAVTGAEIVVGLLTPWPLTFIIDYVVGANPRPGWMAPLGESRLGLLVAGCAAYLFFHLLSEFISVAHTQMQVGIGQRLVFDLRQEMFAHLQNLSLRYHLSQGTGETIYHLENDAYCVDSLTLGGALPIFSSAMTLAAMFVVLLWIDWQVALMSLIVVPFLLLVNRYYSERIIERSERVKEMESGVVNLIHEVFSAIRVVKAFGREPHEQQRFHREGATTLEARMQLTLQESFFAAMINVVTTAGMALVLFVSGYRVLQGRLSVGELLVALTYLGSVFGPLTAMSHTIGNVQASVASARRALRTLHTSPEIEDLPEAVEATALRGKIEMRDVRFAYDEEQPVLDGISFEAAPGEMIALVGLTGAGKTSLVSLIPRFYDTSAGTVLIDGRDVRKYRVRSLRDQVSIVLQEPVLFSETIADNIRYGRLDATDEEVVAAAKAAAAHDFIMRKPEGYQTRLGEDGTQLSGGERQRVSIARALLKNAPILIMDEPTSSLDARAEASIFTALRDLMADRTTIVIAHRLSTVRDADKILVLDDGRIAGEGKHAELYDRVPLYRELCQRLSMDHKSAAPGADPAAMAVAE